MSDRYSLAVAYEEVERLRAEHPELWVDGEEQLLADMLEGSTTFNELMDKIIDKKGAAEERVEGIDARRKKLSKRGDRFERRVEGLRALAFKLMQHAGLRKLELDEVTLSIGYGPRKVIVTDAGALPEHCLRITIEPNLTAIRDAIKRGETVPGAVLSNAEETLTVRSA